MARQSIVTLSDTFPPKRKCGAERKTQQGRFTSEPVSCDRWIIALGCALRLGAECFLLAMVLWCSWGPTAQSVTIFPPPHFQDQRWRWGRGHLGISFNLTHSYRDPSCGPGVSQPISWTVSRNPSLTLHLCQPSYTAQPGICLAWVKMTPRGESGRPLEFSASSTSHTGASLQDNLGCCS